ncbi:MAG: hypothetical protein K0R47_5335 [Brevibacillus sp.]|nr:hypothetical protein [Brevibacillus sp.]
MHSLDMLSPFTIKSIVRALLIYFYREKCIGYIPSSKRKSTRLYYGVVYFLYEGTNTTEPPQ